MENESLEIEGFKFLGCTLWTDFKLLGQPHIAAFDAQQWMMDYKKIRVSPNQTALFHAQSLKWLQNELLNGSQQKTIVITHHAPSIRSIPLSDRLYSLSAAFASPLDDFVINAGANLWIHGHIHHTLDYQLGNTRVICNPKGYPDEMLFNTVNRSPNFSLGCSKINLGLLLAYLAD
ncbi:MAG: hypothetical protein DRR19_11975 [Candidatus Parabeggiatoa sp. nov. 1]|nr:MAG: hypothetical protein DRR19_11975 [Gammaproteobacteria bacterium]